MKTKNIIHCCLEFDKAHRINIGKLVLTNTALLFNYSDEYIASNLDISPFMLSVKEERSNTINLCKKSLPREFKQLPGFIYDSLPDQWGMLIMDHLMQKYGFSKNITVMERLAFIGKNGMGALTFEPDFKVNAALEKITDLLWIENYFKGLLQSKTIMVNEPIDMSSFASGGARPKIAIVQDKNNIYPGNIILNSDYHLSDSAKLYLVKFAGKTDSDDIGNIEYAYSVMAKTAGINMPETRLFDNKYFGVERFDRTIDKRNYVITLSGLTNTWHGENEVSYEDLLEYTLRLTENHKDIENAFKIAVFNVLANNRDDHTKNISFIMDRNGQWSLSPAYDIIYSSGLGRQAMSINGESYAITKNDLYQLGTYGGLKKNKIAEIIDNIAISLQRWETVANHSKVSEKSMDYIGSVIKENLNDCLA